MQRTPPEFTVSTIFLAVPAKLSLRSQWCHSAVTASSCGVSAEALLAAILTPAQTQAKAAAPPSNDPWSSGSAVFGGSAQGVSSEVLQPLPGFGDLQQAAGQMQRLLMAGHRLEALRQASV